MPPSLQEWLPEGDLAWFILDLLIQTTLEEDCTQLLGRQKSEGRQAGDTPPDYRNGHGNERKLTPSCGTIEVARPRVRGLEDRFESRVLPQNFHAY